MNTSAATPDTSTALFCMEIWGGNNACDQGVSVPGIDAWVTSQPVHGDRSGGDIHFVSTCGHGQIARFAVADVAGYGNDVGHLSDIGKVIGLSRV